MENTCVAFRASCVRGSQDTIGYSDYKSIHYSLEDFDNGNDLNVQVTDAADANSSVFTVSSFYPIL